MGYLGYLSDRVGSSMAPLFTVFWFGGKERKRRKDGRIRQKYLFLVLRFAILSLLRLEVLSILHIVGVLGVLENSLSVLVVFGSLSFVVGWLLWVGWWVHSFCIRCCGFVVLESWLWTGGYGLVPVDWFSWTCSRGLVGSWLGWLLGAGSWGLALVGAVGNCW